LPPWRRQGGRETLIEQAPSADSSPFLFRCMLSLMILLLSLSLILRCRIEICPPMRLEVELPLSHC
jgi:hypothetical protein